MSSSNECRELSPPVNLFTRAALGDRDQMVTASYLCTRPEGHTGPHSWSTLFPNHPTSPTSPERD